MRYRRAKTAIAVACIISIVIVLHAVGWLAAPERWLRAIVTPGSRAIYGISVHIGNDTETFGSVTELQEAYGQLKQDLIDTRVDAAELTLLRDENDELRKQLSFVTSTGMSHVGAHVIAEVVGKNIEPLGTTVVINRGARDSIAVGNPAIVGSGVLVGKVVRTEDTISVVRLLTDNQSKIAATVLNHDRSIGVVEGGYDVSIRMNFIPQNERVAVADTVITSGLEEWMPRGLLIGSVDVVQRETYQAFQQAVITPAVSLDHIRLLTIITDQH